MKNSVFQGQRWSRKLLWSVVCLLVVWGLAWGFGPALLKSQLESGASKTLGRVLTVGTIDFKPWTLELTLNDLKLASADGARSQLSVERIYLDLELQSLLRLAPVVDAITLEHPKLTVTRYRDAKYDFDDILQKLQSPPEARSDAPLRYAIHNITVSNGALDFVDEGVANSTVQKLRKLEFGLPFLSNLDSQREVRITPRLAFELNGSSFDSKSEGTPFSETANGESVLRLQKFDLTPYLPYLPESMPVRLQSAVVDTDLKLKFAQSPKPSIVLSGTLTAANVKLADPSGKSFLSIEHVTTVLQEVRPLEALVHVDSVKVVAPQVSIFRTQLGQIQPQLSAGKQAGTPVEKTPVKSPWTFQLDHFAVESGTVAWDDASTTPRTRLSAEQLAIKVQDLRWPFEGQSARFEGALTLSSGPKEKTARLGFKGAGSDEALSVQADLEGLSLSIGSPYLAPYLVPSLSGRLDTTLNAQWKDSRLSFNVQKLALSDVALKAPNDARSGNASTRPLPKFKRLELADADVNLFSRTVRVDKVALHALEASVERDPDGRWMYEQWLVPRKQLSPPASAGANSTTASDAPWALKVAEFRVDAGTIDFEDRVSSKPVSFSLSDLSLEAKSFALDGKKPVPLAFATRLKAGATEAGALKFNGTVALDPVMAEGVVDAVQLPAHTFVPYIADQLNLEIVRADTSLRGKVRYSAKPEGASLQVNADASLSEFQANTLQTSGNSSLPAGEELLQWKSLNVSGIALTMDPVAAMQLQIREVSLADFFARIVVNPQGRLNLQDLVKPSPDQGDSSGASPRIAIGPVSLGNGRVLFSDRFIQPNYAADLTQLAGKLSGFTSEPVNGEVQLADLELRGRAEGTASLNITGKLNPLAKPLALDIQGRVQDLELPPLSPYAIKYAGYGIDRGKLNVDVNYAVKPDGQLTASNNIVLKQLSFGEKVEGAPNSLPVKLAVALLADRNGVIDLNLPIRGSLNDPQFSIGPVIWKVLSNLIVKAITSPFSLLASAFGGGDELSAVQFPKGNASLTGDAELALDKVAKALTERIALKVTVIGTANMEAEREALKRELLNAQLRAEKRRRAVVGGQVATRVEAVSPAEYADVLKEVYKRTDIKKPRNVVGLTKDLPVNEMEAMLLANISVNEDTVRELALARGVAVRDYLASRNLPLDRLFLGATKTGPISPDWQPRAELTLNSQ